VHEFAARVGLRTDIDAPLRGKLRLTASATLPEQSFASSGDAAQRGSA